MPSRDLTDVILVSEDHDGPDDHDGMMKMKMLVSCDESYPVMKVI